MSCMQRYIGTVGEQAVRMVTNRLMVRQVTGMNEWVKRDEPRIKG